MKSVYDCDLVVGIPLLEHLQIKYLISVTFELQAPRLGQRPFSLASGSLSLPCDALEAGLRLPLHPLIVSSLEWWCISLSQMVPNS